MRKILLVDDSPAVLGLMGSIVGQLGGFEVIEVTGGFEALRRLPREEFCLIITDINMPDINGLELIAFVRKSPGHATTPILIVSTDTDEGNKQKALSLGANGFLAKPFSRDQLLAAIRPLVGAG
jgi:two-component system, chemotaxis family, chemotaxis protein CheY